MVAGAVVVTFLLHAAAVFLFTNGFFLTRYEATQVSSCSDEADLPSGMHNHLRRHHASRSGCWSNVKFPRVVYIVIDALRYDFMHEASQDEQRRKVADGGKYFLNHLPLVHALLRDEPAQSLLFRFVADAPTMTMQRLKGLTTGTLPTFLDIKDNMHSEEIVEDSWIKQLTALNKSIVFMGDDTWGKLYPTSFLRNYSYDSFNVKDLHTVDNGVLEHFFPELETQTDWDVLIAHFLGVDHVGHTFGPNHPSMEAKLDQMNEFLARLTASLPPDVLAVVLGDHGMSSDGNHGGATDDETGAALFLYSKARPLHAVDHDRSMYDVLFDAPSEVAQVDLVPTLSLLMGLPIPFGNLGAAIPHLFFESTTLGGFNVTDALTRLNDALWVNVHQLRHQFLATQTIRMDLPAMLELEHVFAHAQAAAADANATHVLLQTYLRDALALSRSLYTQFDLVSMAHGIALQLMAFAALHVGAFSPRRLPLSVGVGCFVGFSWPFVASYVPLVLPGAPLPRYLASIGLSVALLSFRWQLPSLKSLPSVSRRTIGQSVLLVLHCASLFSNSYLIVQDRVVLFLSASTIVLLGMDLLAVRKWTHLPPFIFVCVAHRVYAALPHPNIVLTGVSIEATVVPMLALGLWIYSTHPPTLVSYACVWLYWLDILPLVLPWIVYVWSAVHIKQPASALMVVMLLHGPSSPATFALFVAIAMTVHSLDAPSLPSTAGYCFLLHTLYFQSGHGNSFASLQNAAAFVGVDTFHWHVAGALLAVNTFGSFWLGLALAPPSTAKTTVAGYFTLSAICSTIFVAMSRRHLMVWAIFAPKFVFDAAISVVVHGLVASSAIVTEQVFTPTC